MSVHCSRQSFPKVAVIVLNWNGKEDTIECLESVARSDYPSYSIIVVDNGSTDGSQEMIRKRHPCVQLLENGKNLGFAEGNNRGVLLSITRGTEVVFLLNNDTTLSPDCLSNLARAAHVLPEHSVLGAKILYYTQPDTIWHFGSRWDKKRFELVTIAQNEPAGHWNERMEVDHIIGCAMWIPSAVIRKIGLFDQRFFLNYEETDWCFRAKRAGVSLFSIPNALVWHKVSSSFSSHAQIVYFCERNRLLWIEKNFKGIDGWRFVVTKEIAPKLKIVIRLIRRSIAYVLFSIIRSHNKRNHTRYKLCLNYAAVLGWTHYLMRRFGNCPPYILKPFVPYDPLMNIKFSNQLNVGAKR